MVARDICPVAPSRTELSRTAAFPREAQPPILLNWTIMFGVVAEFLYFPLDIHKPPRTVFYSFSVSLWILTCRKGRKRRNRFELVQVGGTRFFWRNLQFRVWLRRWSVLWEQRYADDEKNSRAFTAPRKNYNKRSLLMAVIWEQDNMLSSLLLTTAPCH